VGNHKAGNVGDLWKHLALAEAISIERPRSFWDAYAGNAECPLPDPRPEVFRILGSGRLSHLQNSTYADVLQYFSRDREAFPGSPGIALRLLGQTSEFLFVDTDSKSLENIRLVAGQLGVPEPALETFQGDGRRRVLEQLDRTSACDEADALVLVDPFSIGDCEEDGGPLGLFLELYRRGFKALLWYPLLEDWRDGRMRDTLERQTSRRWSTDLWVGELGLSGQAEPRLSVDPKLHGCGLVFANLSDDALARCESLGGQLVELYRGATYHFRSVPAGSAVAATP
jgi:23S rRNA A2030 N6-methylase RlmJ